METLFNGHLENYLVALRDHTVSEGRVLYRVVTIVNVFLYIRKM